MDNKFKDKSTRAGMYPWAAAARDLAGRLIDDRISLTYAMAHPWLWPQEKRINFIYEAAGYIEQLFKTDKSLGQYMMNRKAEYYDGGEWRTKIPNRVFSSSTSSYNVRHPLDLLWFMRNTLAHYCEISEKVKDGTVNSPDPNAMSFIGVNNLSLEISYDDKFPVYLTSLHKHLMNTQQHSDLKNGTLSRFYNFL